MLRHAIAARAASAVLVVAFGAGAKAQEPPPVAEMYSEQIEVRVVEVEVTVRDRDGVPVTGLGKADFRLLVDGRPVAIDYFSELRPGASPAVDALSGSEDGSAVVEQLPVNVLIYIDEEFSLEIDLERVLAGMEKQLVELRPQDRVAVVAWDGHRLEKLLDWTAPGAEVSATLAAARLRPAWGLQTRLDEYGERAALMPSAYGSPLRAARKEVLDPVAASCFGYAASDSEFCAAARYATTDIADRMRILEIENRIDRTARAVAAATRSFRAPEGRRILALLSGGWANGWRNPENRLLAWDPVLDVADELRYSIYAVDVPGMSNVFADVSRRYDEPRVAFVDSPAHRTLRYLAEVTGGEALIHGERRHVFARVAREASSYYSLAFTAERARDDASHAISVVVLHDGLEVRNRRTYRDLSVSTELDYALEAALLDGTSGGGRTLAASLGEPVREKAWRVLVPLRVELGDLGSATSASQELELRVAAVDKDGRRVLVGPVEVAANADGTIEMPLRLRRTSHDLAVSLHDRTSGESRTANLRLDP